MNTARQNLEETMWRRSSWLEPVLALAAGAGVGAACYLMGDAWCGARWLWLVARSAYHLLGIVIVGMAPLAGWAAMLMVKQCRRRQSDRRMELDYGYISRVAPLMGLMGTVISLALATLQLEGVGSKVGTETILRIIPLTGQALLATIAGLIITFVAETALHLIERKQTCHVERI